MKFTFLLLIFSFAAFSQDLELVKNISSGTEGIEILRKHFDGENLFFVSKDNSNIQTLWFFNKAQNSLTSLFIDEEKVNNYPYGGMIVYKNKVYWSKGSIWARELWVSDGTVAGTQILNSNIGSFSQSNLEDELKGYAYGRFMPSKNVLYFYSKPQNQIYTTLWRTDGTSPGTFILDNTFYSNGIENKESYNDYFYYHKNGNSDGTSGSQDLWVSDGSNTSKVATIHPTSNQGYFEINSFKNFHTISVDSSGHKKLFSISINSPNVLIQIIPKSFAPNYFFVYNHTGHWEDKAVFRWSLGENNPEIWRTDGTPIGTFPLSNSTSTVNSINKYGSIGQYLFMGGKFSSGSNSDFAISNLKNASFNIVKDNLGNSVSIYQYFVSQGSGYVPKAISNGKIYVIRNGGKSLYEIDTVTFIATEKFVIPYEIPKFYTDLHSANNKLIATRNESGKSEDELFIHNGSTLNNINDSIVGTKPLQLRMIGSTNQNGYFIAYHPEYGKEIWSTNGTSLGTQLLTDLNTKPSSSNPHTFVPFLDGVFFLADNGIYDDEPWFSNGDPVNTRLRFDIWGIKPPPPNGSVKWGNFVYTLFAGNHMTRMDTTNWSWSRSSALSLGPNYKTKFVTLANSLYYSGFSNGTGIELYKISNTGANSLVRDIYNSSASGSNPRNLTVAGSWLYFLANGNTTGAELYRSDGTFSGTTIVSDLSPGHASSNLTNFKAYQNELFFVKDSSQLWKCNVNSPTMVYDFGANARFLDSMIVYNSSLYFVVKNGINSGLYRMSSNYNIRLVQNSFFDSYKELISFNFNNNLYYVDDSGLRKFDNFTSIIAYPELKIKSPLYAFGKVYFNGFFNGESELWSVDSTGLISKNYDINSGPSSSNPENLTFSGNSLYFSATKTDIGRELFRLTDCPIVRNINITNNLKTVRASKFINSTENISESRIYFSGKSIILNPGFVTHPQVLFSTFIGGCSN